MARTVPWLEDEAGFLAELARGRRAEFRVALDLLGRGFGVKVGELLLRDGVAERGEFADQADVTVDGQILEIKSRGLKFTSPTDYPYPTAFVGAVRRWQARTREPLATVLLSEKTGAMLVVPTETRDSWTVETVFDHHRRFPETCYAIRREQLEPWEWLLERLRDRPLVGGAG